MGGWGKGKSKGQSKGKGKGKVRNDNFDKPKRTDSRDDDPNGSVRVFVRGFDFGTTDEQFEEHMGQAGKIHAVYWTTKGSATIVYKNKGAIKKAAALDGTVIDGNTRYISVVTGDA